MTSHNNDPQRSQTTVPANAVASILTQSANDAISRCKATSRSTQNLRQDSTTSAALEYLEWSKEHTEEALGFTKSIQQLLAPCLAQMDKAVAIGWQGSTGFSVTLFLCIEVALPSHSFRLTVSALSRELVGHR